MRKQFRPVCPMHTEETCYRKVWTMALQGKGLLFFSQSTDNSWTINHYIGLWSYITIDWIGMEKTTQMGSAFFWKWNLCGQPLSSRSPLHKIPLRLVSEQVSWELMVVGWEFCMCQQHTGYWNRCWLLSTKPKCLGWRLGMGVLVNI